MTELDQLIEEAKRLPSVTLSASTAHYEHLNEMTTFVDDALSAHPGINELIGNNPLQVMYDNHRHHSAFMATVFSVGSYAMLARTLPWVYRAYHAHRFSYDYFPLELKNWVLAAEKSLNAEEVVPIRQIYAWMLDNHERIIQLSQRDSALEMPKDANWLEKKNAFRSAILQSDHRICLKIATEAVNVSTDIEPFYLHVLQPVLYEIGMLWEKAEISVAQEHLASAIVSRVMASVNLIVRGDLASCGKAVVAASPNEYHEIGASMVSDILEHDGWDVAYLGGSVPKDDLLEYLKKYKPSLLALSVTIPFNIDQTRDIITAIRQDEVLKNIKVIVGGRVFNDNKELWELIGADGFTANISGVRDLAAKLQRQEL